MSQINVLIFVESRYKLNRKRVRQTVKRVTGDRHSGSDVEVSVAFVGDRKMRLLNKKYRNKEGTTNVLSFPLSEGKSTKMPEGVTRLGDIVISYPQVIKESAEQDKMVDERIEELVEHSMLHLLGLHHE